MESHIDIIITSASRPALLPETVLTFKKMVEAPSHMKFRFLLHEDVMFVRQSEENVKWAKTSNFFDKIIVDFPPIGYTHSVLKMLKEVETSFIIKLEDDYAFERPIELDRLIWTILQNKGKINQIIFNQHGTHGSKNGYGYKSFDFNGVDLTLYNAWGNIPAIWNMDNVKPLFLSNPIDRKEKIRHWTNRIFGLTKDREKDDRYLKQTLKSYILGKPHEPRYVRHTGDNWRLLVKFDDSNLLPGVYPEDKYLLYDKAPWCPTPTFNPQRFENDYITKDYFKFQKNFTGR